MPKNKRKCERGIDCPYKHQYQHSLEFDHVDERQQRVEPSRDFVGVGHKLGQSLSVHSKNRNPYEKSRLKAARAAQERSSQAEMRGSQVGDNTKSTKNPENKRASNGSISHNRAGKRKSKTDKNDIVDLVSPTINKKAKINDKLEPDTIILCDSGDEDEVIQIDDSSMKPSYLTPTLGNDIHANNDKWIMHDYAGVTSKVDHGPTGYLSGQSYYDDEEQLKRALEVSSRMAVIQEQNKEYEESLRRDKVKEREKREVMELRKAIQESEQLFEEKQKLDRDIERTEAQAKLEPEPNEGADDVATVAFRLPIKCSTTRLTRRFSRYASATQLMLYLKTCDELRCVENWKLHKVVRGQTEVSCSQTINDLDLFPRGVLIVKDLDK